MLQKRQVPFPEAAPETVHRQVESGIIILHRCEISVNCDVCRKFFPDLPDSIFYLLVALCEQFFGFLTRIGKNLLALLLDFCDSLLVFVNLALQTLFLLMYGLSFLFPVALVAYDILKIFIALNIVGANDV